jgi:hypothetical protein
LKNTRYMSLFESYRRTVDDTVPMLFFRKARLRVRGTVTVVYDKRGQHLLPESAIHFYKSKSLCCLGQNYH